MKVVTVHRGGRDGYQVARALAESGMLETLVTDMYWPADRSWANDVARMMPRGASAMLQQRYADGLPSSLVDACWVSGISSFAMSKVRQLPFEWKRGAVRWCDDTLGTRAGRIASDRGAALLSYSYYGHSAFSAYTGDQPRILFQLHPHPASVREILASERKLNPDCASSLDKEWELALPDEDFNRLVEEPTLADRWLVASQFTKRTLVDNGIPQDQVSVIPYGIDVERFQPRQGARVVGSPLKLLFVGSLGQRKGIKYLRDAVDLLPAGSVELTVCGRPVDDLTLLRQAKNPIRMLLNVDEAGLLAGYQEADVFVFPSMAEGFAQVLLEAMASGLPVIATDRTAAPDLIRHGEQGYIVEAGSASDLAAHIEEFLKNPADVQKMGLAARRRAEFFSWNRFRSEVSTQVTHLLQNPQGNTLACSSR